MHRVSGSRTRLLGAVLMFAAALGGANASAADRIAARYEVYGLMGLHVLTLRTSFERNAERYSVSAEYATAGIAGLLADQATKAVANGKLTANSAEPEWFRNSTRRNGVNYQSRVDYRPDGSIDGEVVPPPRNPVQPAAMRGTVDNLTAYLRLERQLAKTGNCSLSVPVFDGRSRYDLVFAGGKRETLAPESGQRFAGSVVTCSMTRHNKDADDGDQEGARQGTLWYGSLIPGADIMIPVRMRLRTQIGTVDAYLAELRGSGVQLRFLD